MPRRTPSMAIWSSFITATESPRVTATCRGSQSNRDNESNAAIRSETREAPADRPDHTCTTRCVRTISRLIRFGMLARAGLKVRDLSESRCPPDPPMKGGAAEKLVEGTPESLSPPALLLRRFPLRSTCLDQLREF